MTNLKPDFIAFAEHVIDALCPHVNKTPEMLNRLFEEYKKGKYIRKPGLIWLNYIVANFFEQDPDDLRSKSREGRIPQARAITMYFMYFYGHRRETIAKFYDCSGTNVSCAVKKIKDVANNKDSFSDRKILSILKYELL